MSKYIVKRILIGILTLFIAITLTFLIVRFMPGDPVLMLVNEEMTPEQAQVLLEEFGLDKPVIVQYGLYMKAIMKGNLGTSFYYRAPVTELILERLPWTLLLVLTAQFFSAVIGIPFGVTAGANKGSKRDQFINAFTIFGISVFIPWLGVTLLNIFGVHLQWFPIGNAYDPILKGQGFAYYKDVAYHLVLPALTLSIVYLANYVLYMRSSMIDVLGEDYIRTARSKGMKKSRVIWYHGVRNALIPSVTMIALMFGRMVGGAVLTETVYAYPGVGRMIFTAVGQQDFPVLQGAFIILAVSVIAMNIIADIAIAYLDPRIKID